MEEQDKNELINTKLENKISFKGMQGLKEIALFLSEEFNKIDK